MTALEAQNGAMTFQPSLGYRIWRALGFRHGAHAGRPDDDDAKYTIHNVITHWDWKDRLRILVTGDTLTEICVETETLEKLKGVRTESVVLASGVRTAHYPRPT